jgi:hypothetical protein
MSKIKWDDIIVATTFLGNQIVIGKLDKNKRFFIDKSSDRANQVVTAVYQHMKAVFKENKEDDQTIISLEFNFEDGGKLVYTPIQQEEDNGNKN